MKWRLLIQKPLPPPLALAIDEAIALCCTRHEGRATLRFYQWDRPAISIGRFQVVERALRWPACQEAAIPVVRRITGGRAVWHHRELTYSVISPLPSLLFPSSLAETVAMIGSALAGSLEQIGIPVHTRASTLEPSPGDHARGPVASRSPFCFATAAWYEILCEGKKVIGSAQRRWRDRFLQQGSILLHHEPDDVHRWLNVGRIDAEAAVGLTALSLPPVEPDRLARQIAQGMADHWGVTLEESPLTDEETALADQLARQKYDAAEWTFKSGEAMRFDTAMASPWLRAQVPPSPTMPVKLHSRSP